MAGVLSALDSGVPESSPSHHADRTEHAGPGQIPARPLAWGHDPARMGSGESGPRIRRSGAGSPLPPPPCGGEGG